MTRSGVTREQVFEAADALVCGACRAASRKGRARGFSFVIQQAWKIVLA